MRVLQVSTRDVAGGAERIAWNLFQSIADMGHTSYLAVGHKTSDDPHVLEIPTEAYRNPWARAVRGVRSNELHHSPLNSLAFNGLASLAEPQRSWNYLRGVEDFDFPGTDRLLDLPPQRPDIIHGHNLHGAYFDLRALPLLAQQTPVILTLHDAWLLSGHCAHSFDCARWQTGCGHCPDLTIYPEVMRDSTSYNWQRKHDIYARSRLRIAVPCRWLAEKVRSSMLQQAIVETRVIPHGIDLSVFRPGDKRVARQKLGLPQDRWMALFVANKARKNLFKDYQTMEAAIQQVAAMSDGQELLFVCLGESGSDERVGSISIRYVEHVGDPNMVADYYRATDVYLHAARAELWGLSITEALACGAPVVATAVGGIPEQIEDGVTGFLVGRGDSAAMAKRIKQLSDDVGLRENMSEQAASSAARQFGLTRMVNDYFSWYEEIIGEQAPLSSISVAHKDR